MLELADPRWPECTEGDAVARRGGEAFRREDGVVAAVRDWLEEDSRGRLERALGRAITCRFIGESLLGQLWARVEGAHIPFSLTSSCSSPDTFNTCTT